VLVGGRQLRQDDPLALKDIVRLVAENVAGQKGDLRYAVFHHASAIGSFSHSSRTRFMAETLTNLKNNRTKKTDSSGADTIERMKKMLSGLSKKHHGKWLWRHHFMKIIDAFILFSSGSHEPLRVTLADLRSADSKGKWWLVGAAWGGDPLTDIRRAKETSLNMGQTAAGENAGGPSKNGKTSTSLQKDNTSAENGSERLLQLAKAQGMNTDIRRSIFVVLMSSDVGFLLLLFDDTLTDTPMQDYVDACDRLSQLTLTEQQQREIVRVLVHCCGNVRLHFYIPTSIQIQGPKLMLLARRRKHTIPTMPLSAKGSLRHHMHTGSPLSLASGTSFAQ
jgi:nucleolar MIF4G domain-containing protein 1